VEKLLVEGFVAGEIGTAARYRHSKALLGGFQITRNVFCETASPQMSNSPAQVILPYHIIQPAKQRVETVRDLVPRLVYLQRSPAVSPLTAEEICNHNLTT
jgi:hypothetical protein